jgi:hypothetical protein
MENKIICRKCGGGHFTIKCNKNKESTEKPVADNVANKVTEKFNPVRKNNNFEKPKKTFFKKIFRIKLSELPINMTEHEMMELTYDWGHIVKVKVLNYEESSVAYIDFGYEEEADYFIKALDKTPFELLLLSATRVDAY